MVSGLTRHAFIARPRWSIFGKKTLKFSIFQDRFDILLEMRLSGVAEQDYTVLYGKSQLKEYIKDKKAKKVTGDL